MILPIFFLLAQLSPLILFFIFYKKVGKIVGLKVVFFYALLTLITDFLIGWFFSYATTIVSVFALIEYLFFSLFFYIIIHNKKVKKAIIIVSILNTTIDIYILQNYREHFDFWAALVIGILTVTFSIIYFYEQINSPKIILIYNSYSFWIVVGFVIYISGTLFLFLYTSDMKDRQKSPLWVLNTVFEIIKDICFSIAFFVANNSTKNTLSYNAQDTNPFESPL